MKFCKKNKTGSWTLTGGYLEYRREGGKLSPLAYNQALKDSLRK